MCKHILESVLVVFSVVCILISGCTETDCPLGSANELKIRFVSIVDTAQFSVDSLTVTADGTDSILLNRESNTSYITLPLNSTSNKTVYKFYFTELKRDTVQKEYIDEEGIAQMKDTVLITPLRYMDTVEVEYASEKKFTSMDCGLVYTYILQTGRHTANYIKSMAISNTEIKEENEDNIYMFF